MCVAGVGVPQLVDRGVELLAARCPRLQTLDISHCHKLTGASLRSVSEVYGYISHMWIRWVGVFLRIQWNPSNPDTTGTEKVVKCPY